MREVRTTKTFSNSGTLTMVQMALFIALILLMAFTPIGYIRTPGIQITLIVIPVTVGAILLGPAGGAVLGGVFGITSLVQCFGMDPFGTMLFGINPIGTIILTMVPRILMGWLTGVIFRFLQNKKSLRSISHAGASLAGPLLNTVLFMTTLVLIFYRTDYVQGIAESLGTNNVFAFIIAFVTINALIEAAVCFVIGTAVTKVLFMIYKKS